MFRKGEMVLCVAGPFIMDGFIYPDEMPQPAVGETYTVRSAGEANGFPGIRLNEVGWTTLSGGDGLYLASRFRKVERKTDRMNLTEWLSQSSDYEEPKRPAKTKEKTK